MTSDNGIPPTSNDATAFLLAGFLDSGLFACDSNGVAPRRGRWAIQGQRNDGWATLRWAIKDQRSDGRATEMRDGLHRFRIEQPSSIRHCGPASQDTRNLESPASSISSPSPGPVGTATRPSTARIGSLI